MNNKKNLGNTNIMRNCQSKEEQMFWSFSLYIRIIAPLHFQSGRNFHWKGNFVVNLRQQ